MTHGLSATPLARWATGERVTDCLPKLEALQNHTLLTKYQYKLTLRGPTRLLYQA